MCIAEYTNYVIDEGTIRFEAADVNKDGIINVYDATYIQRYAAQYDDSFGIGQTYTFGGEPIGEDGYYLVGEFSGVEAWDVIDADKKFTLNEGATDVTEYELSYTLAEGDAIKVVKVENGVIGTYYPNGMAMSMLFLQKKQASSQFTSDLMVIRTGQTQHISM